jgi:DNA polymerase-3 subunit epsilon
MYRYVVFDVETPNRYNNRMSAIGISIVEDNRITDSFFSYVNPETSFDYFNTKLTGIDEGVVADAPNFVKLWETIEPIMSSGILVAHNAVFDLCVLNKDVINLATINQNPSANSGIIDRVWEINYN